MKHNKTAILDVIALFWHTKTSDTCTGVSKKLVHAGMESKNL